MGMDLGPRFRTNFDDFGWQIDGFGSPKSLKINKNRTPTSVILARMYARTHARTHDSHTQDGAHCLHNQDHNEAKDNAHRTFGASVFVPPKRAKGFSHHNSKSSEDQGNQRQAQGPPPLNQAGVLKGSS